MRILHNSIIKFFMKRIFLSFALLLATLSVSSQIRLKGYNQNMINPSLLQQRWQAHWISVQGEPVNDFGVYHFRKSFTLESIPAHFVIHVSADNRYKLFVNGHFASLGPARCDVYNWNFETVDIAPFLKVGKNVLASVVWNYAERKPSAQMSLNKTGFLVQGNDKAEQVVNTNNTWKGIRDNAYSSSTAPVNGCFIMVGPGISMTGSNYPWGWENVDFDDNSWKSAAVGEEAAIKGARDYPYRQLVPTNIPPREMTVERFASVRTCEGCNLPKDFPQKQVSITFPAHSTIHILLDNNVLTTSYLSFIYSKGRNAQIAIGYAEALFDSAAMAKNQFIKGNRNDIKGKKFFGFIDKIVADGGDNRNFTTLWWRTWRYVDLTIKTADEPLIVNDIFGTFTAYPFKRVSQFYAKTDEPLNKILDIGWRTARLCSNETYMDCPYYEQLQYFGDTRIQEMVSLYNTDDATLVKHAIEQGRQSMCADGLTTSRFPTSLNQFISSYSLSWIGMAYDYWMYRGDESYLKTLLPAFRQIMSWYEQWLKPDNSLGYVPYWFFADWAAQFRNGEPIREKDGNSAYQDLTYLLSLYENEKMERTFGMTALADHYRDIADKIKASFKNKYWDEGKQLFADTYDHHSFSQHVNTLAVLADIVTGDEATNLFKRVLEDKSLIQTTIYFRYFVNEAMKKVGLGDVLLDNIEIWKTQVGLGLTTWAEEPEPTRSDCHAWGACLNVEFYRILLGIDTDAPGFTTVRIAPCLGKLKSASGSVPHPKGMISVNYNVDKHHQMKAVITLPKDLTGTFVWDGKEYSLKEGEQTIITKR